jgi:hypothetical protein
MPVHADWDARKGNSVAAILLFGRRPRSNQARTRPTHFLDGIKHPGTEKAQDKARLSDVRSQYSNERTAHLSSEAARLEPLTKQRLMREGIRVRAHGVLFVSDE